MPRPKLALEDRKHGIGGYNAGCRCSDCREAKAVKRREYRTANAVANERRRDVARRASPQAKAAKREYDAAYRARTYDPEIERWRSTVKKYGITKELYFQMLEEQGGVCAVCSKPPKTYLAVDHDHSCCPGIKTCGECVRGLLCFGCNSFLGRVDDDPVRAVSYLARFS